VSKVRDDPRHPDPGFAELYSGLPDAEDLEPWLGLARAARPPVLYLGAGAGRLAVPLHRAGVELVLVDAHPGMVAALRNRLPAAEVHESLIEDLRLDRRFDLVIVPSNILDTRPLLRAAAAQLAPGGRLAFELTNPHWLEAGAAEGFRVLAMDRERARVEVDYPGGAVQEGEVELVWPEEIDDFLGSAGLRLLRMFGGPDRELSESSSFYVVAAQAG
jgi:SAM-dependent methyltransferase